MEFNELDLQAFIAIWKQEFGEMLTVDEARHQAKRLMTLYEVHARREEERSATEQS